MNYLSLDIIKQRVGWITFPPTFIFLKGENKKWQLILKGTSFY